MDHKRQYEKLIAKARSRILHDDVYKEVHHILPRCLGGSDEPENLVALTAKEHFVAHALLCFIFPDSNKIAFAFNAMRNLKGRHIQRYVTSQEYATLQEMWKRSFSFHSPESKERMSKAYWERGADKVGTEALRKYREENGQPRGYKLSKEFGEAVSARQKGSKQSAETRNKRSESMRNSEYRPQLPEGSCRNRLGSQMHDNTREALLKANTGAKRSEETKVKMAEARRAYWARKKSEEALKLNSAVEVGDETCL